MRRLAAAMMAAALGMGTGAAPAAAAELGEVAPLVRDFLGQATLDILAAPDRVQAFRLANVRDQAGSLALDGYKVVRVGPKLDPDEVAELRSLLFNSRNYRFTATRKCSFAPRLGFLAVRGQDQVAILISFSCSQVRIARPGHERVSDADRITDPMTELLDGLFSEAEGE